MNTALFGRAILGGIAVAALGFAVLKFQIAHREQLELASTARVQDALRIRVASLETQFLENTKRAEAVEADNTLLVTALENVGAAKKAEAARTPAPVAFAIVEERFKQARALALGGSDPAAALRELLWCYDEGFSPLTDRRRDSQLMLAAITLAELGRTYPPALDALRERLEKAREKLMASADNSDAVGEISTLARALRDQAILINLYDQLPEGDARRKSLAIHAFEPFVDAQRYNDALSARAYPMMSSLFEMSINRAASTSAVSDPAAADRLRRANVQSVARNIEVLAGAGELDQARSLSGRLLNYDNSPATQALLQQHLARAGQPALLAPPRP